MTTHLVINATEIGRQRGGNESYIAGVIEGLAALDSPVKITLLICDWGIPLSLPGDFQQVNMGAYRRLPFFLWQQTAVLRRLQADWYLSQFFLPPVLPGKGAVLVYDLSFKAYPDYFPQTVAWYMSWLTGLAVKQADRILTISEFSRRELLRFYPAAKKKQIVNLWGSAGSEFHPLANDEDRATEEAALARYGVARPYIFALGNIHPRKNLSRLLDAYLALKSGRRELPAMVWGGLQRWESGELLQRARAAGVILPGFIAQTDLPTFYRQAEMLVYPSLYEGFGMPPLEAMACGTPVIASNTTSLPEVTGDAALTVNPSSVEEIAGAIAQLLDDAASRRQLRQAGIKQARTFTWKRTAQRLLDALLEEEEKGEITG